uniref:Muscle M-line assembly protein unc-89 n=1 Tax=Panagrellus redivivus TaxID=6233 RepID=A0A7E4UYK2_PANRE
MEVRNGKEMEMPASERAKSTTDETERTSRSKKLKTLEITNGLRDIETRDGSPERTFMCSVNDDENVKVTWLKNGTPIDDSLIGTKYFPTKDTSRFSLRIRNIGLDDGAVYTVRLEQGSIVLQSDGKLTVKKAAVSEEPETSKRKSTTDDDESKKKRSRKPGEPDVDTFDSPPYFHYKLEDETVKEGDRMILSVTNTTLPEPDVEWFKNGIKFSPDVKYAMRKDKGRYELIIAKCELDDDADWKAIGKNKYGMCESDCHLTVVKDDHTDKPEFIVPLLDETVYEKGLLKLDVTIASKTKPLTVRWLKDGTQIIHGDIYRLTNRDDKNFGLSVLDVRKRHQGKYAVEAVNPAGKSLCECKVTVKPEKDRPRDDDDAQPPRIKVPLPASRDLPEGAEVKLVVAVTGSPTPTIEWLKDDKPFTDAEISFAAGMAQLVILKAKRDHSGVYSCVATNDHGSVRSVGMVYITPDESLSVIPPKFTEGLLPSSVMENAEIHLECTVTGKPPPTITWYHDGLKLLMTENRLLQYVDRKGVVKLNIMKARPDDAGEYSCEAANTGGRDWTHAGVKVVGTGITRSRSPSPTPKREKGPVITRHLCDANVHEGNRELLECEIDAYPEPTVEWTHDGILVAESKTLRTYFDGRIAFLKLYEAKLEHQGQYEIKVANRFGEVTSKANIKVERLDESGVEYVPNMPKFTQKLDNTVIERSGPVNLEVVVEGTPEPEMRWLLNGKALKKDMDFTKSKNNGRYTLAIAKFDKSWSGTWTAIATNIYGDSHCSAEITLKDSESADKKPKKSAKKSPVQVEIAPSTTPFFRESLADQTVLAGQTVNLKCKVAGEPAPEVTWQKDGEPIQPSRHIHLSFNPEDGACVLNIPSVDASDAGVYMVTAKNANGSQSTDCVLTVAETAGKDKHLVTAEDSESSGPSRKKSRQTEKYEKPKFTRKPNPEIVVNEGQRVEMIARAVGVPTPVFKWLKEGKEIRPSMKGYRTWLTGGGESVLEIECVVRKSAAIFTCIAINSEGEDKVETELVVNRKKQVTLQPLPAVPKFTKALTDTGITAGHPAILSCTVAGFPDPHLRWVFVDDDREVTQLMDMKNSPWIEYRQGEDAELRAQAVYKGQQGTYRCIATNEHGSVTSECYLMVGEGIEDSPAGPPRFLKCLRDVWAPLGETIRLDVEVCGEPMPKIKWLHNESKITTSKDVIITNDQPSRSTLTISSLNLASIGRYAVEASNIHGVVRTNAQVMVGTAGTGDNREPARSPLTLPVSFHETTGTANVASPTSPRSDASDPRKRPTIKRKGAAPSFVIGLADMELKAGDTAAVAGKLAKKRRGRHDEDPKSLKDAIIARISVDDLDDDQPGPLSPRRHTHDTTLEEIRQAINKRNKRLCRPKFLVKPKPKKAIEEYKSLRLKTAISGNPIPEVRWDRDGMILETGNKFSIYNDGDFYYLEVHHCSAVDVGFYNCTATNSEGMAICTSEVEVEANDSPLEQLKKKLRKNPSTPEFIEVLPGRTSAKVGESLSISCSVSAYPAPKIQWSRNAVPIIAQKGQYSMFFDGECATLNFIDISVADAGTYQCVASNNVGTASTQMNLDVEKPNFREKDSAPPKFLQNKQKIRSVLDGTTNAISLSAEIIEGAEPVIFRWSRNKMEIEPSVTIGLLRRGKTSILELKDAFPEDSGEYVCSAENKFGVARCYIDLNIIETMKSLSVDIPPTVNAISKTVAAHICGVSELRFTVTGQPEAVISWTHGGTKILPGARFETFGENGQFVLRIHDIEQSDNGTYTLTAVNSAGSASDSVLLKIDELAEGSKTLPRFTKHPVSVQCTLGQQVQLETEFEGIPQPVASWFMGPKRLASGAGIDIMTTGNSSSLTIASVTERDLGEYLCTVRNVCGEDLTTAVVFLEGSTANLRSPRAKHTPKKPY